MRRLRWLVAVPVSCFVETSPFPTSPSLLTSSLFLRRKLFQVEIEDADSLPLASPSSPVPSSSSVRVTPASLSTSDIPPSGQVPASSLPSLSPHNLPVAEKRYTAREKLEILARRKQSNQTLSTKSTASSSSSIATDISITAQTPLPSSTPIAIQTPLPSDNNHDTDKSNDKNNSISNYSLPILLPVSSSKEDNATVWTDSQIRSAWRYSRSAWLLLSVVLFAVIWVARDVLPRQRFKWLWVVFDYVQARLPSTSRPNDKDDDEQGAWRRISIRTAECGRCVWSLVHRSVSWVVEQRIFYTMRGLPQSFCARISSVYNKSAGKNDVFMMEKKLTPSHRVLLADIEVDGLDSPRLLSGESTLLTASLLRPLLPVLAPKLRTRNLRLIYSTAQHGASLSNLYHYMQLHRSAVEDEDEREFPSVVVVRDQGGNVFGAFSEYPWEPQRGYYGDGQTFLFSLYPSFAAYRWSGRNNFFINATSQSIALGGGDRCAIWLDAGLRKGSSSACQTFDCPQLASKKDFVCVELEAWRFVSTQE